MQEDIITGVRFMGAASMFIMAALILLTNRGGTRSKVYDCSRWLFSVAIILFGVNNLIQFVGHFRESSVCTCWAINLFFYAFIIPIYNLGEINLLRAGHRMHRKVGIAILMAIAPLVIGIVGIACGTLINDIAPLHSTTALVAVAYTVELFVMSWTTFNNARYACCILSDSELENRHKLLMRTSASMNSLLFCALLSPWIGQLQSLMLNSVYGLLMFVMIVWHLTTIIVYGAGVKEDSSVQDECTETEPEPAGGASALTAWVKNRRYLEPNVSLMQTVEETGLPAAVLNSSIKEIYHVDGYRKWLISLRIREAMRLMTEHPEYTMDNVATMCGYSDRSNFTRAFKSYTGMSPSGWMEKSKKA